MKSMSLSGLLTTKSQLTISIVVCAILVLPSIISLALPGEHSEQPLWGESTLATFGLLVGQGSPTDNLILSKRILWLTTLAFALIISNILLGSVTALLSVQVLDMKIDSFQAAYENDFELILRNKSFFLEEYRNPKSDPFLQILRVFDSNRANTSK